jgi:hypothetical protein
VPPLPHHRAYGSVPRRFGGSGFADSRRHRRTFACGGRRGHLHQLVPGQTGGSPRRLEIAPHCGGFAVFRGSRDLCATRPLLQPLAGTVRAFSRWSGLIRPLLTSARRSGGLATSSVPRTPDRSPGVSPAAFLAHPPDLQPWPLMDMDFAIPCPLVRPSLPQYPISVRRVAISLHASFRQSLAVLPLRFTRASPPSGCTGDFHPQAAGHAQHTSG